MALRANIDENGGVNMTPMIDIVFNLLIFFLLSSTYLHEEQELELQLPTVADAMPLTQAPDEITVSVLNDGTIKMKGETLALDELRRRLTTARLNYPDQAVAVRGDAAVRYDRVASVISTCKQAGISQLDVLVLEQ